MERERILDMIKKITQFEDADDKSHPFSVVGPDSSKKNRLRVYAYGGVAGRIGLENAGCWLCNSNYFSRKRELFTLDELRSVDEWMNNKRKDVNSENVLTSDKYLKLVLRAIKQKFTRNDGSDKERSIQMKILSAGNRNRYGWDIADVETSVTRDMLNEEDASKIITVKKPDFVVYDRIRKQYGIIELKVDNKNVKNLGEHYSVNHAIYKSPDIFIAEMNRRAGIMADYNLLDKPCADPEKVWFGFLFVGGGIKKAKESINKYIKVPLENIEPDCRFLYADTAEEVGQKEKGLRYDHMYDIKTFMSL